MSSMKQILLLFLLVSSFTYCKDFSKIHTIVSNFRNINSPEDLVKQINNNFSTNEDKVKASFYWLATNISYDIAALTSSKKQYRFKYADEVDKQRKIKEIQNGFINETFRKRKGICEEYALSLKKICSLLKIPCKLIKGNVRTSAYEIGKIERNTNHAWNIVYVNKKWIVVDATWASGYQINNKWNKNFNAYFYDIPKNKIVKTHYSNDLVWKRFFNQYNLKTFHYQPIFHQGYLKTKAEILSKKSGILRRNNNQKITITFKNLDNSIDVAYAYKGDKYVKNPVIIRNGTITKLVFESPKNSTYLELFFNNRIALQYKVL